MSALDTTSLLSNVKRGMAVLDIDQPNWVDRVSPRTLDVSNCHACVLGQLYGLFSGGAHKLRYNSTVPSIQVYHMEPLGFVTSSNPEYRRLTIRWCVEIYKRKILQEIRSWTTE